VKVEVDFVNSDFNLATLAGEAESKSMIQSCWDSASNFFGQSHATQIGEKFINASFYFSDESELSS
jgi:hypothetical protein